MSLLMAFGTRAEAQEVRGSSSTGNAVSGETASTGGADSGVFGVNKGAGKGVFGIGTNGEGVKGESSNGFTGIYGTSNHNGVVGDSNSPLDNESGVVGRNNGKGKGVLGIGVEGVKGESNSFIGAGRVFMNGGGGDLLRAGNKNGIVFRVDNNGDVLVRGQKLGGATGPQGPPGPPGPPVRTVAVCGGGGGEGKCNCSGREIARQVAGTLTAGCTATSDTQSCSLPAGAVGVCCTCAP